MLEAGVRNLRLPLCFSPMWRHKLQVRNMKPWGTVFLFASVTFLVAPLLVAQTRAAEPPGDLPPLPYFAAEQPGQPLISSNVMAHRPFSVTGPRGALLGQQDGSFEAW